ncbi:MAG: hypothetical protein PVF65_09555 [Sphingomonadales bacterium]
MKSKVAVACMITGVMFSNNVWAVDHGCGPRPMAPELFDPQSADRDQVMANKASFEKYQAANTVYLDCIEAYAKSDTFSAQAQDEINAQTAELNRELQAVMAEEQAYADSFNANARTWVEVQRAARTATEEETPNP